IDAEAHDGRTVVAEPAHDRLAGRARRLEQDGVDLRALARRDLVAETPDRELEQLPDVGVRLGDEHARHHAASATLSLAVFSSSSRESTWTKTKHAASSARNAGVRRNCRRTIASGMRSSFAPTMSPGLGRHTSGAVRLSPCTTKPCCASPPMIRWITCAPASGS